MAMIKGRSSKDGLCKLEACGFDSRIARTRRILSVLATVVVLILIASVVPERVNADEGWVIKSFDVAYTILDDGSVDVVEDIQVDFGGLQKHGIFRDLVVEQKYDTKSCTTCKPGDEYNRVYKVSIAGVDDGQRAWPYETSRQGADLQIKIGDPDKTVSGPQRYRIRYRLSGALNSQADLDEFFWNVTGNKWPVPMEKVTVVAGAPAISKVTCFQGRASTQQCSSQVSGNRATFATTRRLAPGEELTIVVGMPKGAVTVPPPTLVRVKPIEEQIRDFIGLKPMPIGAALLVGVLGVGMVVRYWWANGRDRWLGDVQYLSGATEEQPKPLGAKDTIVVEYTPPEVENRRRLKPAEIGTLMDEKADTLDVSATIVDLAVKGYLRITEIPKEGLFGKKDWQLDKLKPADHEMLGYEVTLFNALFDDGDSVEMSDLKNKFYTDLAKVKETLYAQVVTGDQFFSGSPETTRTVHYVAAAVVMALGVGAIILLGNLGIGAIIGVPIVLAGVLLLAFAGAMPRRTGRGREYFRRSLGFRQYMTIAETERQRFNEEANIFEKYLPYAIVYDCVEKWAKAFEGLEGQPATQTNGWYVGSGVFMASTFSRDVNSFSSSISTAIASTPGGSGGSGFSSGGGFSGGGGGGGGGGSW
jgi:uncharacterized membrane protein YgcG